MKKHGYLFEQIYGIVNIELAHKNARKGKTHYNEVQMVDSNPVKYLTSIQNMLKNKTYKNSAKRRQCIKGCSRNQHR